MMRSLARGGNAFGFLRLFFASLVIVAHTPELIDHNRKREPLTQIYGTVSFGELAVDSFFIISGYLIVKSYLNSPRLAIYIRNRIVRIYPAFIVASLVCICVVAPLTGGGNALSLPQTWGMAAKNLILLQPPQVAGSFDGARYSTLNGSMWTIAYEFRCYILVLVAGLFGLFRNKRLVLIATALLLSLSEILPGISVQNWWPHLLTVILGEPEPLCRLTSMFLIGCLFYLYQDEVHLSRKLAALALLALVSALSVSWLAEPAIAVAGGYLIFFVASRGNQLGLQNVNAKNDVSYGIYLYAWPVSRLIIWYQPSLSLATICLCTLLASYACGWISWYGVEKPTLDLLRFRSGSNQALVGVLPVRSTAGN